MSTYQLLKIAAQSWPERIAIVDGSGSMSFQELFEQIEALKIVLTNAGLAKGMGLGIVGRNSPAFIVMMLAGMGCGAVVLPISHQLKLAEIQHILADTHLHAVLDDLSGVSPVTESGAINIPFLQQTLRFAWTDSPSDKPVCELTDAAFIRYTSGTTGISKGVVLSHRRIKERIETAQKALKLSANDSVLWVLPMAFHFLVSILVYLRYGVRLIICKDMLAQSIIDDINQHKATLLYASPMHFRLLAADLSGRSMDSLSTVISTSAGIPKNIADAFKQRFNLSITQAYGIIEAGLPLMDNLSSDTEPQTVGYPVAGFSIAILNDQDEAVEDGEIGHLAIKGPGMFDAYLKPWKTAEQVMKKGWFMTGDLAQRRADGRITICGREKSMINMSGNKAFPEEIETVLNNHPDIIDSYVFAQAHPLMGEIVCAEVIVETGRVLDVENVLQFCRLQLSTYKIPQKLNQVEHIQQTQSGKIKRIS
jgi:acyl-coenzyme A synthetase/AMP-(fatty) acid ligase